MLSGPARSKRKRTVQRFSSGLRWYCSESGAWSKDRATAILESPSSLDQWSQTEADRSPLVKWDCDTGLESWSTARWDVAEFYLPNCVLHVFVPQTIDHDMSHNVPLQWFENFRGLNVAAKRMGLTLRMLQKSFCWTMDLVAKRLGIWHPVLDFCAGRMAVVTPSLHSSEHRCFEGCEKDGCCVKEALQALLEVHT